MFILQLAYKMRMLLKMGFLQIIWWVLLLDVLFGSLFYFAERGAQEGLTYWDSIWWAMVTMTTVGYGDYYAKTAVGRFLISYPCMLLGIGIIGYLVGTVATSLIEWTLKKRKGEMKITFKHHIIICNYPGITKVTDIIGELRATNLHKNTRFVLVNDKMKELPNELARKEVYFVKGLPTDEETLFMANILECEGVLILCEDTNERRSDDRTYTVGSIIELIEQEKKVSIKTVAELVHHSSIANLERAGVDGTVTSEGVTGRLLVQEFVNPGINKVLSQIITNTIGSQLYLYETKLAGRRVVELQQKVLEHEANIQVIGIIQNGHHVLNPPKQVTIQAGDKLIVLAENNKDLDVIERDILAKTS